VLDNRSGLSETQGEKLLAPAIQLNGVAGLWFRQPKKECSTSKKYRSSQKPPAKSTKCSQNGPEGPGFEIRGLRGTRKASELLEENSNGVMKKVQNREQRTIPARAYNVKRGKTMERVSRINVPNGKASQEGSCQIRKTRGRKTLGISGAEQQERRDS